MGRKPTVNLDLPSGMRRKKSSSGTVYYYLDNGIGVDGKRRWEPLGSNFPDALRAYASKIETTTAPPLTVPELLHDWNTETAHGRPKGTIDDIKASLPHLIRFFGDPPAPLSAVQPVHIKQYLSWRVKVTRQAQEESNIKRTENGKTPLKIRPDAGAARANREISWLSAAWNWARENGKSAAENPVTGVTRNKETGRNIYVEDDELALIMQYADAPLSEAIELAYLIGQRPCDLREISETDIRSGVVLIEQNKTGAKQRIEIVGALAALIERIKARKAKITGVRSLSLICNEDGQPLRKDAMRYRFDKARRAAADGAGNTEISARIMSIQFRDLRAKAASDVATLEHAQRLLGHTTRDMTEHYVRQKRGTKVSPVK